MQPKTPPTAPRPAAAARRAAPRPGLIQLDLGAHKAALQAFFAKTGTTLSQGLRTLGLDAMRAAGEPIAPKSKAATASRPAADDSKTATRRLELRLTPADFEAIQGKAEQGGFTQGGYVQMLIRKHIGKPTSLGSAELRALGESNQQLVAILQALRKNAGAGQPAELGPLLADLRNHINQAKQALAATESRWHP